MSKRYKTVASKSTTKRHKSTSSSSASRPDPNNPFNLTDDLHLKRFKTLASRPLFPTRYYDEYTLTRLGLLDDIYWLFQRVGMRQFLDVRHHTYRSITLEILSTIHVEILQGHRCNDGLVSFRLNGILHELTLDQFNAIYNLPTNVDHHYRKVPDSFRASFFWSNISDQYPNQYRPSTSKATHIQNPCFRYAQRILSSGLFGRDDSANVARESELYFLSSMYHAHLVDVGAHMARHFHAVANRTSGGIAIGGLLTPLAMAFGFDPAQHEHDRVTGPERLDFHALEMMHMCRHVGETYMWHYPNKVYFPLPNTDRTSLQNPANLHFMPEETPPPDQPLPPAPDIPSSSHHIPHHSPSPSSQPFDMSLLYDSIQSLRHTQLEMQATQLAMRDQLGRYEHRLDGIDQEIVQLRESQTSYQHHIEDTYSSWRDWHMRRHPDDSPPPPFDP